MEKEQDTEIYIPFAEAKIEEAIENLTEKTSSIGNYKVGNNGEKRIINFLSKLLEGIEKYVGKTYFIKTASVGIVPEKWRPLLEYLEKNKIISELRPGSFYCDVPKFIGFNSQIDMSFKPEGSEGGEIKEGISSFGASLDNVDLALSKVIGEALERSQLAFYQKKEFKKYSIKELKKRRYSFLNPLEAVGFSDKQKDNNKRLKYNEETVLNWSEGRSLMTNKKTLIPSQLVYWNYLYNKEKEPFLREPNTNGAGGHYKPTDAILSGLYELIQRDGFLIYWLNKLSPKKIKINHLESKKLKDLIRECESFNFEVIFLDIITDIEVPNCVCVLLDNSGVGPKITIGMDCGSDWENIIEGSLLEALGIYGTVRSKIEKKKKAGKKCFILNDNYIPFRNEKIGQYERLEVWANEKMFGKFEFFIQGEGINLDELIKKQKKFSSSQDELEYLIDNFKNKGKEYEIFYYQVKNRVLSDLGYSVVRVIIPELMSIYLNEVNSTLGSQRLKEVPGKIGYKPAKKFNPWPHPFI